LHPAVFKSNAQCIRFAAGRRTQNLILQKSSGFRLLFSRHWHITR